MRRPALTLLAMLAAALAFAGPAAAYEPSFGLYIQDEDVLNPQTGLRDAAALGARHVRGDWRWWQIEPQRHRRYWSLADRYAEASARAGLDLVPTLVGSPRWASGSKLGFTAPRDPRDYARFAAAAARRYGPGGHFWRERPEVPYRPVRSWQIWNEPNLASYWRPRPQPRRYAGLLRRSAEAIRSVDPGAEIVMAGLPMSSYGMPPQRFLKRLYRHGVRGAYDTLAVHPYGVNTTTTLAIVQQLKRVVDGQNDRVPIRISEYGWANGGEPSLVTVDDRTHADLVHESLLALRAGAWRMRLVGMTYFKWHDRPAPSDRSDTWPFHTGLLDAQGRGKRALHGAAAALRTRLPELAPRFASRLRLEARVPARGVEALLEDGLLLRTACNRACRLEVAVSHERSRPGRTSVRTVVARHVETLPDARRRSVYVSVPRRAARAAGRRGTET